MSNLSRGISAFIKNAPEQGRDQFELPVLEDLTRLADMAVNALHVAAYRDNPETVLTTIRKRSQQAVGQTATAAHTAPAEVAPVTAVAKEHDLLDTSNQPTNTDDYFAQLQQAVNREARSKDNYDLTA